MTITSHADGDLDGVGRGDHLRASPAAWDRYAESASVHSIGVEVALFAFDDVHVVGDSGADVLSGITAEVPGGVVTSFVGPSGSGKSTLLRLCNRLEVPSRGCVRFRGVDVGTLDPLALRRRVGMVFQRPTPFPGTVRDNLAAAAPDAGDRAWQDCLERVDLPSDLLDRNVDLLSGGEAQRVCLARSLAVGPEVLLLDEPTSALDPEASRVLERLARRVADECAGVIWVSHDHAQVRRLAYHVLVLDAGRLVATGRPGELSGYLEAVTDG